MPDKPGKIEHYEKRFGVIAIEMGFITSEDLIMALKIQVLEDIEQKRHRLMGEILMDEGKITPEQISEVVEVLFKSRQKHQENDVRIVDFPSGQPREKT